ncbi:ATP-binding response regulator [Flexithrix dorotheae]|uniref:ATP-binding response regulator n=1 Tax=Flexithrix dorotheae TaxID=70993 RepID=UPI00036AD518|nr:response regulator [Flexithrix dorotheae]
MARILLIEDEKNIRESIEEILSLKGYEVTSAQNGKSGYLKAVNIKPDLIICDIMMPEIDGYDFLKMIRETKSIANSPFIFLTALSQRENHRKGINLGADDYITKPFKIEELLQSIESRLLRKKETEKEIILKEQKRYAKDLHDGLQQVLLGIKYTVIGIEKQLGDNDIKEELYSKLKQQLDAAIEETRTIAYNGSPLGMVNKGLCQSIELLCNNLNIQDFIRFKFSANLNLDLDINLENALFRLVQECISNILKHAEASIVTIFISQEKGKIVLTVKDNGKGSDKNTLAKGRGIKNMMARLQPFRGDLEIESKIGIGTSISISVPI